MREESLQFSVSLMEGLEKQNYQKLNKISSKICINCNKRKLLDAVTSIKVDLTVFAMWIQLFVFWFSQLSASLVFFNLLSIFPDSHSSANVSYVPSSLILRIVSSDFGICVAVCSVVRPQGLSQEFCVLYSHVLKSFYSFNNLKYIIALSTIMFSCS